MRRGTLRCPRGSPPGTVTSVGHPSRTPTPPSAGLHGARRPPVPVAVVAGPGGRPAGDRGWHRRRPAGSARPAADGAGRSRRRGLGARGRHAGVGPTGRPAGGRDGRPVAQHPRGRLPGPGHARPADRRVARPRRRTTCSPSPAAPAAAAGGPPWPTCRATGRVFAPPPTADAVLLFSDGRFAPPAVAPPTFAVIDPALDDPPDAAVRRLRWADDRVTATVAAAARGAAVDRGRPAAADATAGACRPADGGRGDGRRGRRRPVAGERPADDPRPAAGGGRAVVGRPLAAAAGVPGRVPADRPGRLPGRRRRRAGRRAGRRALDRAAAATGGVRPRRRRRAGDRRRPVRLRRRRVRVDAAGRRLAPGQRPAHAGRAVGRAGRRQRVDGRPRRGGPSATPSPGCCRPCRRPTRCGSAASPPT